MEKQGIISPEEVKENMLKKRYLSALLMVMAMLIMGGITKAHAPVEEENTPGVTALPVSEEQRMDADAKVYQTMYFLRCGHNVSRRVGLAEDVKTATFSDVQGYYELWHIASITKKLVEMERQLDLYCPMHQVVNLTETGQVVLCENRYGDGMAVKKVYDADTETLPEEKRNQLLAGIGFDSEEEAERWLEKMGILP